jgi:preprotein translocase subunit YajC
MTLLGAILWQAQASGPAGLSGLLVPFLLMLGIMYFIVFLPQQRFKKKQQAMLDALKNGDKVITNSGIYGSVAGIDGNTLILKIADQVKIRIARSAIAQVESSEDAK